MLKPELRKNFLENRGVVDVERESVKIAERVLADVDFGKVKVLHCFLPIERFREVETRVLLHMIWFKHSHVETVVPRVDFEKGELECLKFTPFSELVKNAWMVHEPKERELVECERIDVVLVPLLAYDKRGYRVGYGKGYYDKFLAKCRPDCLKIGLSFFPPVDEIEDVNEFDVKLDRCVTPDGVFRFRGF